MKSGKDGSLTQAGETPAFKVYNRIYSYLSKCFTCSPIFSILQLGGVMVLVLVKWCQLTSSSQRNMSGNARKSPYVIFQSFSFLSAATGWGLYRLGL